MAPASERASMVLVPDAATAEETWKDSINRIRLLK